MKQYKGKDELKEEIKNAYKKYIDEFDDIDENLKDKRFEEVDRTPAENLNKVGRRREKRLGSKNTIR